MYANDLPWDARIGRTIDWICSALKRVDTMVADLLPIMTAAAIALAKNMMVMMPKASSFIRIVFFVSTFCSLNRMMLDRRNYEHRCQSI